MIERLISLSLRQVFQCAAPLVVALCAPFALAQTQAPATTPPVAPVTLNFVDADIDVVAKAVGELTGKTFVIDPRVKGKINIQSARGVAPNLAFPTFLAALRMAGFAVVESGSIVRIVPEMDAKTLPTPVGSATSGVIATKVLPIANQSAAQIANAVRPMLSAANANALVVYAPGNALIVTDYSDNIRRIEALIARLDTPSVAAPEIVPLNNANALDVAATINRVFADGGATGAAADVRDRMTITADARSNSLIVRSEDGNRLARVKTLIQDLDRPTAAPGNIRIVYLKHADAAQVAQTLRRVLGADGGGNGGNGANGGGNGFTAQSQSPLAALLPGAGQGNPASSASGAVAALAAASAGSSAMASGNLPQLSQNGQTAFTAGGATVYADAATNSLVISSSTGTYNNLRAVIEQLDVRRAQVFIEALIVEVQADKAAEFGIQWQTLDGLTKGNTQGFGGTNFGTGGNNIIGLASGLAAGTTTPSQGLNVGLVRGAITIGKNQFFNLGLLARALQNDTAANILSMPTLLALDNEEARFSGGQNVPFLTGQYATTGGGNNSVTPFNTVERRDVGLTLKVKPLITEGGAIRLQLYQEVSNIIESAAVAQGLGSVNKRVLESSVLADDGQIVVLGGLLQEGFTNDQDKVPVLGDAPFIGNFFRYDSRKRTKTNLMIFLRPTVLRDALRAGTLSNDRYRALGLEQLTVEPDPRFMLPPMTNPGMPLGQPVPTVPTVPTAPSAPATSPK